MEPKLEEVFKVSGVPTYTFVKPAEYKRIIVGLRTPGRGLVVEGPSGIGKTTSILKALEELHMADNALVLSARKIEDRELISQLPSLAPTGIVIIDDFHRLSEDDKQYIADFLKTLADEERSDSKIIIVGINRAGDSLVKFAADLNNRIDTIRFEANPEEMVLELIEKGERALNISINTRDDVVHDSHGSFHIAQMLCRESCMLAGVLSRCDVSEEIAVSLESVREHVIEELGRTFYDQARKLATGPHLRREGRAPYLHLLNWLSTSDEWSVQIDRALAVHSDHRGSVGQIVDKGYLEKYLNDNPELSNVVHYDPSTRMLGVEDPKFMYYIRNLIWSKFARQVGYLLAEFKAKYDFALSFAGEDRDVADALYNRLAERQLSVFYDKNEQHRILAGNIEDYLAPIYRSESRYIIVVIGPEYPKKLWTKFESEQFKSRFGTNSVIPVRVKGAGVSIYDALDNIGIIEYDRSGEDGQIDGIVELLSKRLVEDATKEEMNIEQ